MAREIYSEYTDKIEPYGIDEAWPVSYTHLDVYKRQHKELLKQKGTYRDFISIREQAEGWRIQ